jgi:hypothetical protein
MVKRTRTPAKKRKGPARALKAVGTAGVAIATLAALYKLYQNIQAQKAAAQAASDTRTALAIKAAGTPVQMQSMTDVTGGARRRRKTITKRRK